MASVAIVSKEQVARISRKEIREILKPMKEQLDALRKTVAELKKERLQFRREMATVSKATVRSATPQLRLEETQSASAAGGQKSFRFSANGFRKLRERLDLSQPEMAALLGSSVPAVYSWESGNAQPREVFRAKMAIVRSLTKRSARKLLEDHVGAQEAEAA